MIKTILIIILSVTFFGVLFFILVRNALKRKIDICFKQKRPRLVQAINRQVSDAIVNNTSLVEDSVKLYKGVQ